MTFLAWIVLGGVAGWLASMVMKTDASQGILLNIVIGIVGAFIGGMIFNALGESGVNGFNVYSLVVATIGAVVSIWLVKLVRSS